MRRKRSQFEYQREIISYPLFGVCVVQEKVNYYCSMFIVSIKLYHNKEMNRNIWFNLNYTILKLLKYKFIVQKNVPTMI
jgi:hypothetical protein